MWNNIYNFDSNITRHHHFNKMMKYIKHFRLSAHCYDINIENTFFTIRISFRKLFSATKTVKYPREIYHKVKV